MTLKGAEIASDPTNKKAAERQWDTAPLLAMIAHLAVQLSTMTFIHKAFLFIKTS